MPYRRHLKCPLLTTYGHALMLIQRHGSLRKDELVMMLKLSDAHVKRVVNNLHAEGLIASESIGGRRRWRLAEGFNLTDRLDNDVTGD